MASRPARARGLKLLLAYLALELRMSRPARARGLKRRVPFGLVGSFGRAPRGRVD